MLLSTNAGVPNTSPPSAVNVMRRGVFPVFQLYLRGHRVSPPLGQAAPRDNRALHGSRVPRASRKTLATLRRHL